MFINKFSLPWLLEEAADDTTGAGLGGDGGAVEDEAQDAPDDIEIHDSLASRMSDKAQQALMDIRKDKAEKAAAKAAKVSGPKPQVQSPKPGAADAAAAAAVKKPAGEAAVIPGAVPLPKAGTTNGDEADGVNVIDFGAAGGGDAAAAAVAGDEPPAPDTTGMDDAQKAKFIELHKDNAKVRKRAQEAEAARDAERAKHEAAQQRLTELENSPSAASGNMFAEFTDAREVGAWVADAQARIALILDDSKTTKLHKDPTGEEIDLGENETKALLQAQATLQHAGAWNQQRTVHAQSIEKAKPVVAAFKEVPEFGQHHAEIAKQDPHAYWPQIVARAAIGALVESGAYRLVKKGFVKASAASNADPNVSGGQKKTAQTPNPAPAEVTGGQPPAGRADAGGGSDDIPSELTKLAMTDPGPKGQEALREIVRLKTLRGGRRNAA